ncbi:hypothetical protein JGD43_25095 [Salmonella enterica subsp. enterica serovar Goldcoast]|nr:hypothetical protein [Salmonella enterica subsp. enterica serovar Goldcoast]
MSEEYINGVCAFTRAAEEDMLNKGVEYMYFLCINCENMKMFKNRAQIEAYLIRRGFKKGYTCWTSHGEEQIIPEVNNDDIAEEVNDLPDVDCAFDEDRSHDDNLDQMLRDAEENYSEREFCKFEGLMEDSRKPLFPGCKSEYTRLSTVLELLKLKASNRWSDKSFTALLGLLADILPEGNVLPSTTYQAKKVLCPLGMEVERIHACPNDCILYRKEYADMHVCPVCKASRYKRQNTAKVKQGPPAKMLWYLPVIPRLKRLFANPKEARLLRWHSEERKRDGKLRHPADSAQWRNFDRSFEEFGAEPRNIRLGLSTDGMNPFGNMSSRHST